MKRRDIVIGLLLLLAAAAGIYYILQNRDETEIEITPSPTPVSVEEVEGRFNIDIPDDAETAELSGEGVSALATRESSEEETQISVLADLPDLEGGRVYQAWIVMGEEGSEDFDRKAIGSLRMAKGGFLLEFTSSEDLTGYNEIIVSLESSLDDSLEEVVLEGSF